MDPKAHWEQVYTRKAATEVSAGTSLMPSARWS